MYGGAVVRSDVPVQVIAPAELTGLLTRLQHLQGMAMPEGRLLGHAEAVDVKGGLSELIVGEGAAPAGALNGADDDVINLVSMLFEFILGDTELAAEIKALIGRLQIPMLKVALLDKNLFGGEDHPARQLVNRLAQAGIGWALDSDDGLFAQMEKVVHSVLNDFVDDLDLFDRLLADFDQFLEERGKRTSLIESRLRDHEEGQAKNNIARHEVQQAVATRLAGRALPPVHDVAAVDSRWRETAEGLAPGAWVEFIDPDFRGRAKIAARIRAQDKFIFVNGRGSKIAEKTIDQLAAYFAAGVARLVSDAALFDRALENMIARLKSEPAA